MHSLQCQSPRDVLLLIKSSVIISDDLALAKKIGIQPVCNLVRYHSLNETMIFRCFVKEKQLIAISQKDVSTFSQYLTELKPIIREKALKTITKVLETCPLSSFTTDIYIDIPPNYKTYILGFNSYNETTSSCLFS